MWLMQTPEQIRRLSRASAFACRRRRRSRIVRKRPTVKISLRGKAMKPFNSLLATTALTLALATNLAHSEDIDLYTGGSSGGDANVLIVLDNNSNWSATMDSNPPADAD